jgi:hypothetical protein
VGIPGNEKVDNKAREALEENLDKTEENWITEQHEEQQQTLWEQKETIPAR